MKKKRAITFFRFSLLGLVVASLCCQAQELQTPEFSLRFDPVSQTLLSMRPEGSGSFDFLPAEHKYRQGPGYYQLGDIDLRLRFVGDGKWQDYSSALGTTRVKALKAGGEVLVSGDISADLQQAPLSVQRDWLLENRQLVLRFRLTNPTDKAIEIGGLGIAMVFDSILTGRDLDRAHEEASFVEPYLGLDAGFVRVTRLNGRGPALVVMSEQKAPLENWMPILDEKNADGSPRIFNDPTQRTHTFEGFYDWMVLSKGFAGAEWRGAKQWNRPTSRTLAPGETYETAVRFALSPAIRETEKTLSAHHRPVAVGIPGYVVPEDLDADLFLNAQRDIDALSVYPEGALSLVKLGNRGDWQHFKVRGKAWGRARLEVSYDDGSRQSIHYFVMEPMAEAVDKMGRFLYRQQWYEGEGDPFGRGPSIMGYDREAGEMVLQEQRAWIAGLSDEGGAGPWLAAIMKELGQPRPGEVARFERFYTQVLDGHLQVTEGPHQYGVRKSLFYYDPEALPDFPYAGGRDWDTWASWDKKGADSVERSYNYPHVAAAQWVLYRLARFHRGLVEAHDWRWYLERAFQTSVAMERLAPHYAQFGQMEGSVFVAILKDLYAEGMTDEARALEAVMKKRAEHWAGLKYPFGSEMPWDSTGQEEVYAWMRHFGKSAQADMTREVILGYDLPQPHWGYNGSARRFWDFLYAGKYRRLERQLHHYGSTLNALPLLDSYRRNPEDFYLLRVGYGGIMGGLTNIDREGFASAAFHSFPDRLRFDPYSGDYGSSFFGHAFGIGSYLVRHPEFGWLGFGGEVTEIEGDVTLVPRDAFKNRVYIAPARLWLTLDAGTFGKVAYRRDGSLALTLNGKTPHTPEAMLNVESYGDSYRPAAPLPVRQGRYAVELRENPSTLILRPRTDSPI